VIEKIVNSETVYQGKILDISKKTVKLVNGKESVREIVIFPKVAVIIPFEPPDTFYLIKQFRTAANQVLLEAAAGKIDDGEDPLTGAKRELQEETGITAAHWTSLGEAYATPGFCTEYMYYYMAENLTFGDTDFDHDENIEQVKLSISEIDSLIKDQNIHDNKTLVCYFLAKYTIK